MSEVFIPKHKISSAGLNIGTLFRRKATKGDIGIEIEVEGNKFPKHEYEGYEAVNPEVIPKMWKYHKDGSLRGEDNAEYVLDKPIMFSDVPEAVKALWKMFDEYGTVLSESNRTSVHVHLNAQKFHLNRLCSFFALYFSVEEILTQWCGDNRVGNMFCLRAKDAPAIVSKIKTFLQSDGQSRLTENLHYAGVNAQALSKFGSIEIRSLRGVTDYQIILDWVSILERIYKMSEDFPDPRAICDTFSGGGPLSFFDMILGDKAHLVRQNVAMDNQQMMEAMYDGIRLAQDLCYCRDWSLYKPVDVADDPFGRGKTKVAQGLVESINTGDSGYIFNVINSTSPTSGLSPATFQTAPVTHVSPGTPAMTEEEMDAFFEEYTSPVPEYSEDDEEPF